MTRQKGILSVYIIYFTDDFPDKGLHECSHDLCKNRVLNIYSKFFKNFNEFN